MFRIVDILSKLRDHGAPAKYLETANAKLAPGGLETHQPYLLIGSGQVLTSDSGALHQGRHNYYVLPLSLVRDSASAMSRRAA
jgi:hypothetical protein